MRARTTKLNGAASTLALIGFLILVLLLGGFLAAYRIAFARPIPPAAHATPVHVTPGRVTPAASVPVLAKWGGDNSHVDTFLVERITEQAAWNIIWKRHAPDAKAPEINFSSAMVIAIFMGRVRTSVIPSINLEDVTENDNVDVAVRYFVNDVVRDDWANLYLFVVLPRTVKPVRVVAHSYGLLRTPQERSDVWAKFEPMAAQK
jgi:hypothetical protein